MSTFCSFTDLNDTQLSQYRDFINHAFPPITQSSKVIQDNWERLEKYFPHTQLFMIDDDDQVLGFMNTIPLYWDQPMDELPDEGWDWMMKKGIHDHEKNIIANTLGGLQVIIPKHNQGKGYSKLIIHQMKKLVEKLKYANFIIPIRPTFKYKHPEMDMSDYIQLKENGRIYDPWIRTHLSSGAEIIKVCDNSMNITGDILFWEGILNQTILKSGKYTVDGALNLVEIDIENNTGEYREDNVWISYES